MTQGASDNEALLLTGAAGSESSFNPNAVHDGGRGHGLFGHNDMRLDMRGKGWRQQATDALAELRRRSEHGMVERAKTDEQLADAEMYFERPRGFTTNNPRGGDNYTGRLGTIRRFRGQLQNAPTPPALPKLAHGSFGGLDADAFKRMTSVAPLGPSAASMYAAYDNSRRGDTSFNQTVNVHGATDPQMTASAVKAMAERGSKDFIRNLQGATQ